MCNRYNRAFARSVYQCKKKNISQFLISIQAFQRANRDITDASTVLRNLTDLRMLNLNRPTPLITSRPQGESPTLPRIDIQTIARSAYRSSDSRDASQNLRIENAALHPEIREFSDRACPSDARLTGWFPNTNKNRGLQRVHYGLQRRERDVAWQLIHVRVIHFRGLHSCWYVVRPDPPLHCPRVHLRRPRSLASPRLPRRCTARTIDATEWPTGDKPDSRWSDFKPINGGFALNLQSALIRITRYAPTNCAL